MSKVCSFCGNKNFREKTVQYIYRHDGHILMVNHVPCEECEYCGEQYFRGPDMEKIEADFKAIYASGKKVKKEIAVPVEEFAEI